MAHAPTRGVSSNLDPGHACGLPRAVRRWLVGSLVRLEAAIATSATACQADA